MLLAASSAKRRIEELNIIDAWPSSGDQCAHRRGGRRPSSAMREVFYLAPRLMAKSLRKIPSKARTKSVRAAPPVDEALLVILAPPIIEQRDCRSIGDAAAATHHAAEALASAASGVRIIDAAVDLNGRRLRAIGSAANRSVFTAHRCAEARAAGGISRCFPGRRIGIKAVAPPG